MKLKLILFSTLVLFTITCCSDNDNENQSDELPQTVIVSPNKISWTYPSLYYPPTSAPDPNYHIEYDSQGRVSRRVGVKINAAPGSGLIYTYSNLFYTDITYNGNLVTLGDYSFNPSEGNIYLNERKVELDGQGRIFKRIIPSPFSSEYDEHLTYHYDNNGKLENILTEFPNRPYDPTDPSDFILTYLEKFTYNNDNLILAEKIDQRNYINFQTFRIVEFDNFDTKPNPFSKLGILDDYFYFSLSKNNPQKNVIKEFDYSNNIWKTTYAGSWNNQYDTNGNLKLFQ